MWEAWLDPEKMNDLAEMKGWLMENPGPLEWYHVSRMVNAAENEGVELIRKVS